VRAAAAGALLALLLGAGAALAQESAAPFKAGDIVYSVAAAADGSALVAGSRDSSVYYLGPTGELRWRFKTPGTVYGVAAAAGRVAVATESQAVFMLDETGGQVWEREGKAPFNAVGVAPDGGRVVAGSEDGRVVAWDASGQQRWEFPARVVVNAVAALADGAVAGTRDSSVYRLDADGAVVWRQQLDAFVTSVAARSDGGLIVAGSEDGLVVAFDGAGGQLWSYQAPDKVRAVAVAERGDRVALGGVGAQVSVLDGRGVLVRRHDVGAGVRGLALSADGGLLVVGTDAGEVRVVGAAAAAAAASTTGRLASTLGDYLTGLALGAAALLVLTLLIAFGQRDLRARRGRSLPARLWNARLSYAFLLPTFGLLVVFSYYPALSGLAHSFTEWHIGGDSRWVGLANFERLLTDQYFRVGFGNLLILTLAHFAKTFTAPLLVAELIFNLRPRFMQYWARTAFVVPTVVPGVVTILLWLMIYEPNIGLLNQTLRAVGFGQASHGWLGDPATALPAIIMIGFPWVAPFAFLVYYAGLIAIPVEVIEASRVDGCSTFRRFVSIDLPLLMGQVKLLVVLGFIGEVQSFGLILLTTGGGPGHTTYVPALQLYYAAMQLNQLGYASAIASVLFLVILGGTLLNLRLRSAVEYQV
jgi:ABC-type sugar transport system permease subunit/outer membrane protein assembly factor BamB